MLDEKAENAKKSEMLMVNSEVMSTDEKGLLQLSYNRYFKLLPFSSGAERVQTVDLLSAKDWSKPMQHWEYSSASSSSLLSITLNAVVRNAILPCYRFRYVQVYLLDY